VREEGVDTGRDVWLKVVRSSRSTEHLMRWIGLVERNYYWSSRRTSGPWNPWTTAFGGVGSGSSVWLVWSARQETLLLLFIRNGLEQHSADARVPPTPTRQAESGCGM
jgi:hypothetical protein